MREKMVVVRFEGKRCCCGVGSKWASLGCTVRASSFFGALSTPNPILGVSRSVSGYGNREMPSKNEFI